MGQGGSTEQDAKLKTIVNKLSKMEINDIGGLFKELSTKTQEGESVIRQPTWLNRDKFAEVFGITELVVEQLFEAFDRDKNGLVDMEEFMTGMALCLHGSVKDKCILLFKIFNLDGDDGISKEELTTVLTSCLQSAHAVLLSTLKSEGITGCEETLSNQTGNAMMVSVVVDKIVKDAFEKCDISGSGKLEVDEFVRWVHKNPKLMNNVFVMQCPKPSSQLKSLPLSASSFSIINTPVEENTNDMFEEIKPAPIDEEEIDEEKKEECKQSQAFLDMTSTMVPKSQSQTLLNMATTVVPKPRSVQDFFSQPTEQENFFDSFGSETASELPCSQQFNNINRDSALPRTLSETCFAEPFDSSMDVHGRSETNISHLSSSHKIASESLQSITLSQDSLLEDKTVAPQFMQTENFQHESSDTATFKTDRSVWHPLQNTSNVDIIKNGTAPHVTTNTTDPSMSSVQLEPAPQATSVEVERQISAPLIQESEEPIMEESKCYYSYWQPNFRTLQQLTLIEHGQTVDQSILTFPSVLVESQMGDPVKDLVSKYLGEQEAYKRPALTSDAVEMNEIGIQQLLACGCWRAAVDLTTKYLTAYGQGISYAVTRERTLLTPKLLQIWFVRISLLVKLRMFSSAEAELNAFNDFDAPDMYYQFYPQLYPGRKGSIVPFSFRLLHAELPQHNGRPNIALDRLYTLLFKVKQVVDNISQGFNEDGINEELTDTERQDRLNLWNKRYLQIHYSLGNCFLGMKEYTLAVKLFKEIIKLEPEREIPILSTIGRVYLQFGDIATATRYFQQVDEHLNQDDKVLSIIAMNRGYLSLVQSSYEEAYQMFTKASRYDPENLAANNNAAVCLLFLGKVKEASNILESMVCRSPDAGLHEDILFNLNTVYELETSRALQKKHKLLDLVSKHKGDGFNAQSLKLT